LSMVESAPELRPVLQDLLASLIRDYRNNLKLGTK
jgi:hypothetical protein